MMKPRYILFAALAASSMIVLAKSGDVELTAWTLSSPRGHYAIGAEGDAWSIKHMGGDTDTWGSLTQVIPAEKFRGRRVRFQARVKTESVNGWAGLWMRVDNTAGKPVAFYNSQDKPIRGSVDWLLRSVVLDVPDDAGALAFGVIDDGVGKVWIDTITLEPVGTEVEVNSFPASRPPKAPSRY
jgi:hypothetical protein